MLMVSRVYSSIWVQLNLHMAKSTKQLASELGLLRKRPLVESPSRSTKKRQLSDCQTFSYLIIIDFESTCWENDKYSPQEIIEFPAVLLNTQTGQIETEFHYYLQPAERPILSDFCKQLTGIKQEMVDNGIPLYNCLRRFTAWLNKLKADKGVVYATDKPSQDRDKLAAFVTWSDWDLGVCLQYETKRKQVLKPSVLNRWIDLRKTYKEFYTRKPDGLCGALKDLGILFDGREHSGLDDARNTAKLAWRMLCDGCEMKITKIMKTNSLQTPLNSESTNLNVSHLKVANVPFQIAVDPDASVSAKLPVSHIHQNISSENNGAPRTKELCLTKKNVLANATNIIHSKPKPSPEKHAKISPLHGENSKAVRKIQHCSKLPVLQSDWNKVEKDKIQLDSMTFTETLLPSPSMCRLSTNKQSSSSGMHIRNATSPACNLMSDSILPSPHKSLAYSTPTGVLKSHHIISFSHTSHHTTDQLSAFTALKPKCANVSLSDASNFKTPTCIRLNHSVQSAFKKPDSAMLTNMKRTPPLCSCGRRSKRRLVQNQGPNQGRWFFTCSVSPYHDKAKAGCKFFQWENPFSI